MRLRLLDSFNRRADATALAWLLEELPTATRVRIGSGYFDASVLDWLEAPLRDVITRGGDIHLVLGSNRGQTARADLERLLPIVAIDPARAKVTVVFLPDVLYHPKTYFVARPDQVSALIGSPNLTVRGLAQNIEAAVSLHATTSEPPLDAIEAMLDPVRYAAHPNARPVRNTADLTALANLGIIDVPRPVVPPATGAALVRNRTAAARRRASFPPATQILGLPALPPRRRGAVTPRPTVPAAPPAGLATPAVTTVVFAFAPNDLKMVGTQEISVPRGMRDWAEAVSGVTAVLGGGTLLEATVFARLAAAPSSVTVSPTPGRLWVTGGGAGRTHFDVRFVLGNSLRRDLNNASTLLFGDALGADELGVFELPADPSSAPVRLTVFRRPDPHYATIDALAVRTPRNQKRQAVVATPFPLLPPWPF